MGVIYEDIELINADDLAMVRRNNLGSDEVKHMSVSMLVDTGAYMTCINETIQEQLQLPFLEKRKAIMANGNIEEYEVVGPIILKFKNRTATCNAFVLRGNAEPLLGSITREEMDVLIHPLRQELILHPDHPYFAQLLLKRFTKSYARI